MLLDRAGTMNEALGKVKVRQAINYAIDRDAMLKAVAQGHGTVTGQIFPETSPGYDAALDEAYPFDPEKAKELLAEAGYPDGFDARHAAARRLGTTTSYDLVKQYLGDVGITVNYTAARHQHRDHRHPRRRSTPPRSSSCSMDPTAWQEANFVAHRGGDVQPVPPVRRDPKVDDLVATIQTGSEDEADTATAKELNKYVVDQAWFAPWYRVRATSPPTPTPTSTQQTTTPTPTSGTSSRRPDQS